MHPCTRVHHALHDSARYNGRANARSSRLLIALGPLWVSARASWSCVAITLGMACASTTPRPVGPGQIAVGQIDVKGTAAIDADELRDGLGLTHARETGRPFERYLVAMDRRRIRGFYARRGFFEVEIQGSIDRKPSRADVTFTIREGPRAGLARVEIVGVPEDSPITQGELRRLIPLADGAPYDHETWELARPSVIGALEEADTPTLAFTIPCSRIGSAILR